MLLIFFLLVTPCEAAKIYWDNFEYNTVAHWETKSETNATIATSTEQEHGGSYSLKVNTTTNGGSAYVYKRPSDDHWAILYIRFWVYITSGLVANLDVNGEVISLLGLYDSGGADLAEFSLSQNSGVDYLLLDYHSTGYLYTAIPSSDTWHCIEGYIERHATTGDASLWVNGTLVDSDANVDTGDGNPHYILIGSYATSGVTGAYYIDDFIVDAGTSRKIGTGWRILEGGALKSRYHF